ncbi:YczE/YyaS/YitT family protein [Falsibacillus albus]|uniref:YitT family protein n=1 Tax=Falsibacillus albus TaxID=2478915 RepID=A0A3L7K733_9BACI|nr:YitT family protein [Falsibacillus albus]RLQ98109.1 YitT family protein [Falsibacillus albus]
MDTKKEISARLGIFVLGLWIMALGIVFLILADIGATPWDVLHVGLAHKFGLTIGTWSILIGFIVLGSSSLLTKTFPQFGAYLNMILVGVFIDLYMLLPFMETPKGLAGKITMFLCGMIIMAYGMGLYISARIGAGPRDSFMLAVHEKTGWKIPRVRRGMELIVLLFGWILGGPVSYGTIIFSAAIGTLVGFSLPQCQKLTDYLINKFTKKLSKKMIEKEINRGAKL